jgi:hypothetical protein
MLSRTIFMKFTTVALVKIILLASCVTAASSLTDISVGMTKKEVRSELGSPQAVALSFVAKDGSRVDVWEYRLSQYEMATTLSPYFDIYSIIFVDDVLKSYSKTERGSRLGEGAALRLIGK